MNQLATRATAVFAAMAAVLIITVAMAMNVSAQSGDPDWKQSPTGLTVSAGDEAGELEIIWDAHPQTSKTLSHYRITWTPDGEAFKPNDQTEWYDYPTTNEVTVTGLDAGATYQVRVRARYDDNKRSRWSDAVSGQTAPPTNTAATGQPTITGTAQVRETLTAIMSEIADDNGLTNAVFTYQWIHSANDSEAYISGATASSYLLSSDDLGHSIKIRVSFTDDDGYTESLTSIATALVVMPPNVAATGQPTVTGTVEAGDTLTATTSSISDDNGLKNAVFTHQWVRSANGADADITDATGSTYVLTQEDIGSTIQVQVSFTDDDGYSETLRSNATAAVQEPTTTPVPPDAPHIARSSHDVLVSNTGQTWIGNPSPDDRAQAFTTGTNSAGYVLTSVVIGYNDADDDEFTASIWTTDASGAPSALKYSLTAPTFSPGDLTFTAPADAALDANTTYTVVSEIPALQITFKRTSTINPNEDPGAATGWSIADTYHFKNSAGWTPSSSNRPMLIAVHGSITPGGTTDSDDATLSALVLQDASDNSVLTLDPTFDAATLEYGATVGRDVGEITIIPTPNDTDADYEIQDGDGTALTDADTTQDEFQVSIARGLNTIQIEVTAEDDATNQTYAVTVTRPRILVSSTGQTSGGSAITGNNAGTQTKHAQKFTTGSNPTGYTLDEVRIYLASNGNAATPVITVNSGTGTNPGAVLYTLDNPGTFTDFSVNSFTAPSEATLDADTSYFVVMENSNTANTSNAQYNVGITSADGEDSSGLSDWDIDNAGRTGTPNWGPTSGGIGYRIQVRGTVDVDPNAATLPELSFDITNKSVSEDITHASTNFLVKLEPASTGTVTVDYATSDITAEAGDDYTETSGTLTFAPGEQTKHLSIPITDDAIYETTERFSVTLSNPTGATLDASPEARVNILDDESPPTASIADITIGEGAGSMTLTLNLSHESSRPTGYFATTADIGGTATQGADYENFLSGGEARITVPAGDTQEILYITITDDTAAESSETITIHWENDLSGGNGDATPASMDFTGTITDNDSGVQLSIQDASEDESSGSIVFTIDISGTFNQNVSFNYTTSIKASDTAEAEDFTAETNTLHTLSAGSPTGIIEVFLNDDDLYEGDETFTVTISNPVNASIADATATGTIIDDETQPTLSISPASATEGDTITFTVDLIGNLTEDDVTFDYATSRSGDNSESDDFTATSGTGTITAGSTTTTFTVPTHDDGTNQVGSIYEGDETFTVTISNPTIAGISQATAKGTILDDERFPRVSFASNNLLVSEQAGDVSNFISFNIVPASENPEQVSLLITGTATSGDDYSPQSDTVDFPRLASQQGRIITIIDDSRFEIEETVIITMVGASNDTQIELTDITRTLIITDNDDPPVLSFDDQTINVNEDAGPAVLTVNKVGDTEIIATVDYATEESNTAKEGEDYIATSGTLTFYPGESSKTISIPIINDNTYEDPDRFQVHLENPSGADLPSESYYAAVNIQSDDPVPTASMQNVTANERAGTMTLTLKLSHASDEEIEYFTYPTYIAGTATVTDDYINFVDGPFRPFTVPAGQLSKTLDITLIDDDLDEPDETILIRWTKLNVSDATPEDINFVGTITDPPVCDSLGNLENAIVVMNLTGEITQAGQSKFHRIKLDPYRSYMIEAIGRNGEDMLGVEEHPNLTLFNPDIPAIWNAKATSRWITYGDRNDGDQAKNVIRRFLDSGYRTYKVEVNAGNNGTGTYQLKIRVNNICRLDENDNAHYQWAGGPKGYPANSDLPAGTGGRQVLLSGTDWGNDNVTRPEMHHVLGDNWNSDRDEDWIGVDLEQGEIYTVRLRTKNSLPERLQATQLKILGMKDANGNAISSTASAGSAGKKVFLTDWTAPSTGRFHIAVGSEGADRTGTYWLSIIKDATN